MDESLRILAERDVADKVLEVANLYNDLDTSDLQGVAGVASRHIVKVVCNEVAHLAEQRVRTVSQFATAAECAAYNLALRDFAEALKSQQV